MGLVPRWTKDPSIGNKLINARSETAADKSSFREAFTRRWCLVPADGFYEWSRQGERKRPFYFQMRDGEPFAIAGLWEPMGRWRRDTGDLYAADDRSRLAAHGGHGGQRPAGCGRAAPLQPRHHRRLRVLTENSQALVEGKRLAEPLTGRDEIVHLDRAFHRMADALEERSSELKAANKELEAFSYSVSHDLRAPLRHIDGFASILLEDYAECLDEEGRRVLGVVCDSSRQMGRLIDDILTFSRLSRVDMKKSEIDMADLACSVAEELRRREPGRAVDLRIDDLPAARGDPSLMRQVFVNLISNALKFTRHKPEARVEVGAFAQGGENVYYVRDNGAGFDMAYADKLFGVFQRLHREEEFEGTGIGLTIIRHIVERHGGRVWAEGRVNEGATFYFTLS
jgi:signal transduction histidine kinase